MSTIVGEHARTVRLRRGVRRLVAVVVAILLGVAVGPVPVALGAGSGGATASSGGDVVEVAGFDLGTDLPVDVVAGDTRTSLGLTLTAGRRLVDGTVRVELPRSAWTTPLHRAGLLRTDARHLAGSVVVRPLAPHFPVTAADCRGAAEPVSVSVARTPSRQVVTVDHLTCRPGQHISIRLVDVRIPTTPGLYGIPVRVDRPGGPATSTTARVRVGPPPGTHVVVDVPAVVTLGRPVPVVVSVERRDGRRDRGYRGWVQVLDAGGRECVFEGGALQLVHLGRREAGRAVVDVVFQTSQSHRLVARDLTHRSREGRSARFVAVAVDPPTAYCSVSYH